MVAKTMLSKVLKEKPKTRIFKDKVCYACEICGFAYEDPELAEECETWCKEYHNCNLKLARKSVNFNEKS